jgi:hypothetical protein
MAGGGNYDGDGVGVACSCGDAEARRFKILPRRGNAISQFAGGKLTDQLTMRSMVEGERGRAQS